MIHPVYCPCHLSGSLVSLLLPQPLHQAPKNDSAVIKNNIQKNPNQTPKNQPTKHTPAISRVWDASVVLQPLKLEEQQHFPAQWRMRWIFQFRLGASHVFIALSFHGISAGFKNVLDYVLTPLLCQSVHFQNLLFVYFVPKGGGNFVSALPIFFLLVQYAVSWAVAIFHYPPHKFPDCQHSFMQKNPQKTQKTN